MRRQDSALNSGLVVTKVEKRYISYMKPCNCRIYRHPYSFSICKCSRQMRYDGSIRIQNVESIGSLNTWAVSHRTSACARNSNTFRLFCEKRGNFRCSGKTDSKFHVDAAFVRDRARVTTAVSAHTIKWTPYWRKNYWRPKEGGLAMVTVAVSEICCTNVQPLVFEICL